MRLVKSWSSAGNKCQVSTEDSGEGYGRDQHIPGNICTAAETFLPFVTAGLEIRKSGSPQGIHFQHKTMVNDGGT